MPEQLLQAARQRQNQVTKTLAAQEQKEDSRQQQQHVGTYAAGRGGRAGKLLAAEGEKAKASKQSRTPMQSNIQAAARQEAAAVPGSLDLDKVLTLSEGVLWLDCILPYKLPINGEALMTRHELRILNAVHPITETLGP
eukprot:COSAG05_NODE_2714_length_2737_cov_140.062412_2_plen_139_part_00